MKHILPTNDERRVKGRGRAAEIRVHNTFTELERVSGIVERFGEEHGLAAPLLFEINLALDEVLTNVISYGFGDSAPHEIAVRLWFDGGQLVVQVEDDGRPFNPLDVADPNVNRPVEDRPIGGLGIHLVRRVTDQLEYRRDAGRNVLVMRKTIGA